MSSTWVQNWILTTLSLGLVSIFLIHPRITHHSDPWSDRRYHHHMGDGAGDIYVLKAHQYWTQHGYRQTFGVLSTPGSEQTGIYVPYTHCSSLPGFVSSLLLRYFEKATPGPQALQRVRWILYGVNLLLTSLALGWIASALALNKLSTLVLGAFMGWSKGFYLFADHLFYSGYVFSLMGLTLGCVLVAMFTEDERIKKTCLATYMVLSFCTLWAGWESAPALWLFPVGLLLVKPHSPAQFSYYKKFMFWTVTISLLAIALRLVQSGLATGHIGHAAKDWIQTALFRSVGIGGESHEQTWTWAFLSNYPLHLLMGYKYFAGTLGVGIVAAYLAQRLYRKDFRGTIVFIVLSICCISWNIVMPEHSLHFFTTRYAVWPAILAFALFARDRGWTSPKIDGGPS